MAPIIRAISLKELPEAKACGVWEGGICDVKGKLRVRWSLLPPYYILFACLCAALLLRVTGAVHQWNLAHPDEVFQTQEPAHRLAYGYGILTWEWRRGIRSWVFPAFLAGIMRLTGWLGTGSTGYLVGIAAVLSFISLTTVWFGFSWARRIAGIDAAVIAAVACTCWYELVYFAPKALTEVVAGHVLLPGLYLGVYAENLSEKKRLFFAGVLCGLAASLRIQLFPAVAFASLYFCRSKWRQRIPVVVAGLFLPIVIFGLVDKLTWSYPFQSFFLNPWVQVIEGRSVMYGIEPWYWYLLELIKHLGPMTLFAVIGARRSPFLGWMTLIILGSHSVVSHKEARFLYPLVPIVITLAALGLLQVATMFRGSEETPLNSRITIVTCLAFCVLTSVAIERQFAYWDENPGGLIAFHRLSADVGVCGIGLYGVRWLNTGGYTYLHRNVPIVPVGQELELTKHREMFNTVISDGRNPGANFELVGCSSGVCIYKRPGLCTVPPGYNINRVLAEIGD